MLKELFKKREEQTDQKKKIENIVAFIIILYAREVIGRGFKYKRGK